MNATATQINKFGSQTNWKIEGIDAAALADTLGLCKVYSDGSEVIGVHANNKREAASIRAAVEATNRKAAASVNQPAANERARKNGGRYVERASIAQRDGLNHGKSWVASGHDVDAKSLHPSWEGELICYVYED